MTEYFRNGTSSSEGEIFLRGHTPEGGKFEIMYTFMAKAEWMLRQKKLTEKLLEMKTTPKYLEANGERINVQYLDPAQREQLPKIEDMIPVGVSDESEIIEIDATTMRVKSEDRVGNEKIIVNHRRDRPFVSK